MADLQALFHAVNELSAEELKQLYLYIVETRMQSNVLPENELTTPRILGLSESLGETWVSDDFDDELPDSFWFGEEDS